MGGPSSRRHHYIPQFYLRGFTTEGSFHVYDKKKNKVKDDKYVTKSVFFENDRNNVTFNGEVTSEIEDHTALRETKISDIFRYLQEKNDGPINDLTAYQYFQIQFFLLHLHYEVPATDEKVLNAIKKGELRDKLFKIYDGDKNDVTDATMPELLKEDYFVKSIRINLGMNEWIFSESKKDLNKYRIIYNPMGNNLICDNPIIIRNENLKLLDGDFIVPLTKHHTLIKTERKIISNEIVPEFTIFYNLQLMDQAERYVSCPDNSFLQMYANDRSKVKGENIKETLFHILDRHC